MRTAGRAFALLLAGAVANAASLYISPEGHDDAPGTLEKPLRSLTAARDAIRTMRQSGAKGTVTVWFRGGRYELPETFVLTPRDSDVVYAAYQGERPVVSGGRPIAGWKKGNGPVWTAPCPRSIRQLFVNSRRAARARTPNNGFYRIDGPSSQDKPFLLKFRGHDIRKEWAGRGVEIVALLAWSELRMPVVAVDEGTHTARLGANPRPSNQERDARYFIENAPDGLDEPGEWYLDRSAGTMSYWPLPDEDLARAEVIAPELIQLVRLEGEPEHGALVRNVVFRGLDFRHAGWSMPENGYADEQAAMEAPSAFDAVGAEEVAIEHCAFSGSGGYAVWFGRGCRRNRVIASEVFDMGAGAIKIGETVQRPSVPERNFENTVADNDLHDLGQVYPSAIGVWVGQSSRNTISHNHIHDLYYTAVSVGWTWGYEPNQCAGNLIEFNHLHHIGKRMLSDMGAIYTLGVQPGTVIRNNLIHDVQSFTYGGWGIYPDEGSSNIVIENNIVYRTKSAGFHQHYGRENLVRNNVFAFGQEHQLMRTRAEPHMSFNFEGNIVYFDSGALLGSNWSGGQFQMNRNIYWDIRGGPILFAGNSFAGWQKQGRDTDSLVVDPQFRNAQNYDFTVLPSSPAWRLGWKQIDMSTVGPRVRPGISQ
jgi:parallel beta-helix repeat protein